MGLHAKVVLSGASNPSLRVRSQMKTRTVVRGGFVHSSAVVMVGPKQTRRDEDIKLPCRDARVVTSFEK